MQNGAHQSILIITSMGQQGRPTTKQETTYLLIIHSTVQSFNCEKSKRNLQNSQRMCNIHLYGIVTVHKTTQHTCIQCVTSLTLLTFKEKEIRVCWSSLLPKANWVQFYYYCFRHPQKEQKAVSWTNQQSNNET